MIERMDDMLMIDTKLEKNVVLVRDILTNQVKAILDKKDVMALIENILDYETISVDGKVFDNPLTRDK